MSEVLVEGKTDKAFIATLLDNINKAAKVTVLGGKGNVCNRLEKRRGLVAFIDEHSHHI